MLSMVHRHSCPLAAPPLAYLPKSKIPCRKVSESRRANINEKGSDTDLRHELYKKSKSSQQSLLIRGPSTTSSTLSSGQ